MPYLRTIMRAHRSVYHSSIAPEKGARRSFDAVTIAIHWITVALVASLFAVALLLEHAATGERAIALLQLHRSLGATVWTVTAVRLLWRLTGMTSPPFPDSMPQIQRHAATWTEYALYGFLLIQPLTGLAQTLYLGRAFDVLAWSMPALVKPDFVLVGIFHKIHLWGALAFAGLIGLHASAALLHALVLKDGVFEHMAPIGSRKLGRKRYVGSSPKAAPARKASPARERVEETLF